VQLDCGIHPAKNGLAALPFFDEIDPSTIDLLLISQYVPFVKFVLIWIAFIWIMRQLFHISQKKYDKGININAQCM